VTQLIEDQTLAQRTTVGVVTGDMFVNGTPLDQSFPRKIGYGKTLLQHIYALRRLIFVRSPATRLAS
jgi:hypothetical protein